MATKRGMRTVLREEDGKTRSRRRGRDPNLTEKLAATLLVWLDAIGNGIPYKQAQQMTADQIVSLFQFDHARRRAHDGSNHPTNLTPRLYRDHREKTNKIDIPEIAKGKKLAKSHSLHQDNVARKAGNPGTNNSPKPVRTKKSRPLPGGRSSDVKIRLGGVPVNRRTGRPVRG